MPQTAYTAGLAIQWARKLLFDRFSIVGWSWTGTGDRPGVATHTFGNPPEPHITMEVDQDSKEWRVLSIADLPQPDVFSILESAIGKADGGDTGDDIVYRFHLGMERVRSPWKHLIDLQRRNQDEVRVIGTYRLGTHAVLEFEEQILNEIEAGFPWASPVVITVDLFVPGPCDGPVSNPLAAYMAELVVALCALATGRPILPPDGIFQARRAESESAMARRHDDSIPDLEREGTVLDVFTEFRPIGSEAMDRVSGALFSYSAALDEAHMDISTMLFVTAMEALLVPPTTLPWAKSDSTRRFRRGVRELCHEAVDDLLQHPMLEKAFGYKLEGSPSTRRTGLLNGIYDLRSRPSHSGIGAPGTQLFNSARPFMAIRRALLSKLARSAIQGFLDYPRSFLVGHPGVDELASGREGASTPGA